jgi:single-strand DNA-binding protein
MADARAAQARLKLNGRLDVGQLTHDKESTMPYASINRVTILGNLTHDPELRELSSGRRVCHMRVACNGRRRNLEGGYDSKPNYFDVSVFGPQGESAHRYLQKGRPVAVDGRLDWSEWETVEGQRRQSVTILASDVQFLHSHGGWSPDGGAEDELQPDEGESREERTGVEAEPVV